MVSIRALALFLGLFLLLAPSLGKPQWWDSGRWAQRTADELSLADDDGPDYYNSNTNDDDSGSSDSYDDSPAPMPPILAPSTKGSKGSKDSKDWQKKAVDSINEYRSQANIPKLKHDPKLSKGAQDWANIMAKTCNFDHSDTSSWGDANSENIADVINQGCSDALSCTRAGIKQWMAEVSVYDCRPLLNKDIMGSGYKYYEKVGHYMNLMDKSKTAVGVGYAKGRGRCKDDLYIVSRTSGQDMKYYGPLLKKARDNDDMVDSAKLVPCPK